MKDCCGEKPETTFTYNFSDYINNTNKHPEKDFYSIECLKCERRISNKVGLNQQGYLRLVKAWNTGKRNDN